MADQSPRRRRSRRRAGGVGRNLRAALLRLVLRRVERLQRAARRVGVGRVQSGAERRPVKRRRPHLLEHEVGVATDASPAVRSAPASLRRVHAPLFVRWHGVGVGVESAPASARSGLGRGVGPGLGIPCRRGRRRGRCGPRRGRRFQVQVSARPRVSAEITVCRVGQPSALLRDARSYTTPWATYGSTASSATAASMPCGSGPRHRRRSSK